MKSSFKSQRQGSSLGKRDAPESSVEPGSSEAEPMSLMEAELLRLRSENDKLKCQLSDSQGEVSLGFLQVLERSRPSAARTQC